MPQAARHRRPLSLVVASAVLTAGLVGAAGPVAAEETLVPYTVMLNNFESTVGSRAPAWSALDYDGTTETPATTSFATADYRTRTSHARSLRVFNRDAAADGAQMTIPTTLLTVGQTYTISAWVYVPATATKLVDASPVSARVRAGSTNLAPVAETDLVLTPGTVKNVRVTYTHVATNTTLSIAVRNTLSEFYIDDVHIQGTRAGTPITVESTLKDTLGYPIGAAIEGRSTVPGTQAEEVLSREFDSATPENAMKPESWYGPDQRFAGTEGAELTANTGADAIMDWALANDARVYGHVLVWHSQVPSFFFANPDGGTLTNSPEHQQILKDRLRAHIFNIAEYLSTRYGAFGSAGNPLRAIDVVNEVVADSAATASNGLRTSSWYNILGEQFIDLSFQYADEAFNDVYADPTADRPVKLFINEYGTEGGDGATTKLQRYYDLVARLLARDVPVDGIGNQFHVQLTRDVNNLRIAMEKQADLGLLSAVTEFDVTTGYPATERLLIQQGHYYKAAFDIFNEYNAAHPGRLYSVTVWGLHDAGSWLYYSGAPTMFDDFYLPKWALVGALGGAIPDVPKALNVFGGSVALTEDAASDLTWDLVARSPIGSVGEISMTWVADHLTAYVSIDDATVDATDAITFTVRGETYTLGRNGEGVPAVVTETETGWVAVAHLPLSGATAGGTVPFTFAVTDGATTTGWNSPGILGELTLLTPLSSVAVVEAPTAPEIDATIDTVWADATTVTTGNAVQGTGTASADVRTLWSGDGATLYVLAEVTDPVINTAAANPWEQDSVEIFVDPGNAKNGSYRAVDTQIRISATNARTYGTGNAADQDARVTSAVTLTDTGYLIEAAISLLTYGGPSTVHGLDFQVNDAGADGRRIGVRSWADATGNGYASTARWGAAKLVEAADPDPDPEVPSFSDVKPADPFYAEIIWLATEGITTGFADGTFRPLAPIERQAMAAFLYRFAGEPEFTAPATSPFTDVSPGDPFYKEITWLADEGVTGGFADGTFRPAAPIERQAMAAFLYRFAGEPEFTAPATSPFTDVRTGDPFYKEITWLADTGVTTGFSDGTYRSAASIERQAMAAFLYRFADLG